VQAHCIEFKRPMLNPTAFSGWWACSASLIWGFYAWRLNRWPEARRGFAGQHALLDQEV
jgi:hypothetical protein